MQQKIIKSTRQRGAGLLLTAALLMSGSVLAQAEPPDPFASLGLSAQQRSEVDRIMEQQRQTQWESLQQMQQVGQQLAELYQEELWDEVKVGQVYDRIFALQKQNILSSVAMRNSIMQLLSADQRQALKQQFAQSGAAHHPATMAPGMGLGQGMGSHR